MEMNFSRIPPHPRGTVDFAFAEREIQTSRDNAADLAAGRASRGECLYCGTPGVCRPGERLLPVCIFCADIPA
jgi:hypothetical protein